MRTVATVAVLVMVAGVDTHARAQDSTPGVWRAAQMRGDVGAMFGPDAYPAAAVAAGEQGRVVARLTIATDGHVSNCAIAESSGSAALDARTCEIALARITFDPARDGQGRAIPTMASLPVRWILPVVAMPGMAAPSMPDHYPDAALRRAEQGRSVARLAVAADGKVTACSIVQSSGSASLDAETCHIALTRVRYAPARDPAGAAVATSALLPMTWRLPPEEVTRACRTAARRHQTLPACQAPASAP